MQKNKPQAIPKQISSDIEGSDQGNNRFHHRHDFVLMGPADYLLVVKHNLWGALGLAILLTAAFCVFQFSKTPVYRSESSLVVEKSEDQIINIEKVVDTSLNDSSEVETHISQILSARMRDWVLSKFSEEEIVAITTPYDDKNHKPDPDSILRSGLAVSKGRSERVIKIAFTHRDPEIAALVCNTYTTEYLNFIIERLGQSNRSATVFLDEQVRKLRSRVKEGEMQLQEFRRKNRLSSIEDSRAMVQGRMHFLDEALRKKQSDLSSLMAKVRQINLTISDKGDLLSIPEIYSYGNIAEIHQKLEDFRQEKLILVNELMDQHPKMIELNTTISVLENRLNESVERAIAVFNNRLKSLEDEVERLSDDYINSEERALELDRLAVEYKILKQGLDNDQRMLDQVVDRKNETDITQQLLGTNFKILDLAQPNFKAVSMDPFKTSLYSLFIFLSALFGYPLLVHFLNQKLRDNQEIESIFNAPILGEIPKMRGASKLKHSRTVMENNNDAVVESFRSIYSNLSITNGFSGSKALIITSMGPAEGKSFAASNLAATCANHGLKTILVDCDFHRPTQHLIVDRSNTSGILSYLRGDCSKDELIELIEFSEDEETSSSSSFSFVASGGISQKTTEIFKDSTFLSLLGSFKEDYDLVIIDTPPVGLFPDALALAGESDEILFLLKHNSVQSRSVSDTLKRVKRSHIPIIGVLVNSISKTYLKSNSYYRYQASNSYYRK